MITEAYVRELFKGLEQGDGASFFEHVDDKVDWIVEGTHPLAGHYKSKADFLAGTARPAVARMSAATATQAGVADGDKVTLATARGSVTLPVEVTTMVDGVVWAPAGAGVPGHGSAVTLRRPQ